ncbi:pyrroline-5-carboxylate reductase [Candidatus Woesearchaeota archaeon]|nr:pyrroline-5-carboxylate reductase [Candidatus Woesearchaeota archaeon]
MFHRHTKEKSIKLKRKFNKIRTAKNNIDAVKNSDIVFICVKPQDMDAVLKEIENNAKNKLIVSIAAGIKIGYIEKKLNGAKVIRLMPNVACIAGEMAAGISAGKKASDKDINKITKILHSSGKIYEIDEDLMDAVTAIAGSGPAFFAYFIESIMEAGARNGLPRNVALELAAQTALGTAKLMLEKGIRPEELMSMVASPKGTTIAGLEILRKSDVKGIIGKTIEAAVKRSRELSK